MAQRADQYGYTAKNQETVRGGPVINVSDQMWLIGKEYREGDITIFNDCLYIALQTSTGSQPDTSPLVWKLLSAKGGSGTSREIVVDFSNVTGDTQNEVVAGGPDMNGNETYTFTLAQNVTDLKFIIIGAGGGGGNGNTGSNQPTGGGGGSGFLTEFNVGNGTAGDAYDLVIGLAGANSTAGNASSVTMGINSATALGGSPGTSGIMGFPDIGGNGGDGGNGGGGGFRTSSGGIGGDGGNGAYNGGGGGSGSAGGNGGTGGTGANGCKASSFGGGLGGNSLGGRGGDNEQGGEGGASPSPITAADSTVATSRKGRPGSDNPAITTLVPGLPGGGGGGGGNSGDSVIQNGSSGSPGRVIINYNF